MKTIGPIGVFDSGIGGLSVVAELGRLLPGEDVVYFGDTARVPYGVKSPETIRRFSKEIVSFLLRFSPKLVVAACNTVSAVAVEELSGQLTVPFVDVVDPGARSALEYSRRGRIGVVATEATVRSGAYTRAIKRVRPDTEVFAVAAPLLVPMVEEGRRWDSPLVRAALEEYLAPLKERDVDVVVLGCTHYPIFKPAFQEVMGHDVYLVDSAEQCAFTVSEILRVQGLVKAVRDVPQHRFYVSDNPGRFREIGSLFLLRRDMDVILVEPRDFIGVENQPRPDLRWE
jgi:glutamate racemase